MHDQNGRRSFKPMKTKKKQATEPSWLRPVAKLIGTSVVIFACLMIGTFIGLNSAEPDLTVSESRADELSKALGEIARLSGQQWHTQTEATATALLMTDAFVSGGIEKATEMFEETMAKASEAEELQAAITAILSKHGFPIEAEYQ